MLAFTVAWMPAGQRIRLECDAGHSVGWIVHEIVQNNVFRTSPLPSSRFGRLCFHTEVLNASDAGLCREVFDVFAGVSDERDRELTWVFLQPPIPTVGS